MKRALITITALAMFGASAPRLDAGDKEWAVAGKVMVGAGAGLLLAKAFEPPPVYSAPPVYVQPAPVVYQSAPVVVQQPVRQVVVQQQPMVVYTQPVVVQQPVVFQPAPVFYQPPPVFYQPAPVCYSRPVYVAPPCPPPRYYAHRPSIGFHISIGHHRHRRW